MGDNTALCPLTALAVGSGWVDVELEGSSNMGHEEVPPERPPGATEGRDSSAMVLRAPGVRELAERGIPDGVSSEYCFAKDLEKSRGGVPMKVWAFLEGKGLVL